MIPLFRPNTRRIPREKPWGLVALVPIALLGIALHTVALYPRTALRYVPQKYKSVARRQFVPRPTPARYVPQAVRPPITSPSDAG